MKKRLLLYFLFFLWVASIAWCVTKNTDNAETNKPATSKVDTNSSEEIKIWVIAPLSWPAATYWEDAANVYNDAVEEFNKNSDKVKIKLIVEDGKCNGKDANSAVQKLISIDKVKVIVWGSCSAETIAAGRIAQTNNVVMVSPTSSSPEITNIWNNIFRFWNDINATKKMASYLKWQNISAVAIINENTDYSVSYAKAFEKIFDGTVVMVEKFNTEEKDFSIIAKKVKEKSDSIWAIVIVPNNNTTAGWLLKALGDEWLVDKFRWKIIWSEVIVSETLVTNLWDLMEWMISIQFPSIEDLWKNAGDFIDNFQSKHEIKSSPVFVLLEYEAINIVIDAVQANWYNTDSIRSYLEAVTNEKPRSGVFGSYYFDKNGDGQGIRFVVQKLEKWKRIKAE